MLPAILALIAFIILIIVLTALFLKPLIAVLANTILLYILFLRIYTEITKYKRTKTYLTCGIISLALIYLTGNFLPLWWITTAALLAFVLVHVHIMYKERRKKK